MRALLCLLTACLLTACTGLADGIRPLPASSSTATSAPGTRLPASTTASSGAGAGERHLQPARRRRVKVLNRGKQSDGSWREAEGKAYFVDKPDEARLKVSFFGPFYGGYNVIELDPDYQLSLVTSYNHDYLWISLAQSAQGQRGCAGRQG